MDTVLAGSIAALSVDILIYPLDTIKTRIQDPEFARKSVEARTTSGSQAGSAFGRAVRAKGLYSGVGSVVAVTLPAAAIFFTTYEGVKNALLPSGWENEAGSSYSPTQRHARTVGSHAAASVTAELVSCVVLTPAEMIKQRAQVARKTNSDAPKRSGTAKESPTMRAFRETFLTGAHNSDGVRIRLLKGYVALVSRNLPFTALQFPLYEHLRARLNTKFGVDSPQRSSSLGRTNRNREIFLSGASSALAGAGAGSFAALATTPIDVVKTRIMLEGSSGPAPSTTNSGGGSNRGVIGTLNVIWKEEGLRGVMRGGLLRSAWTALGAGVYLSSYETGRMWLRENFW